MGGSWFMGFCCCWTDTEQPEVDMKREEAIRILHDMVEVECEFSEFT